MIERSLPILLERARAERDRLAALLQDARTAAAQAASTLARLQAFRADCLARAPAATGVRCDGASLAHAQRFLARLDEALGMQGQEVALRGRAAAQQEAQVLQARQRVLALEGLAARLAREQAARERRREQRETDDFAARASAARRAQA